MNGNCHMKKIVMKEISISDTSVEEGWVLTGPQSPLRYSKEAREKRPTFIGSNKQSCFPPNASGFPHFFHQPQFFEVPWV